MIQATEWDLEGFPAFLEALHTWLDIGGEPLLLIGWKTGTR